MAEEYLSPEVYVLTQWCPKCPCKTSAVGCTEEMNSKCVRSATKVHEVFLSGGVLRLKCTECFWLDTGCACPPPCPGHCACPVSCWTYCDALLKEYKPIPRTDVAEGS